MINIAIIEDNAADANLLRSYIDRYFAETDKSYKVEVFSDGFNFLSNYSGKCNIAFFDIEMPHIDGMQVARRLRAVDSEVSIIFVTNMAKYAINGYEVSALDFIIKPVEYFLQVFYRLFTPVNHISGIICPTFPLISCTLAPRSCNLRGETSGFRHNTPYFLHMSSNERLSRSYASSEVI